MHMCPHRNPMSKCDDTAPPCASDSSGDKVRRLDIRPYDKHSVRKDNTAPRAMNAPQDGRCALQRRDALAAAQSPRRPPCGHRPARPVGVDGVDTGGVVVAAEEGVDWGRTEKSATLVFELSLRRTCGSSRSLSIEHPRVMSESTAERISPPPITGQMSAIWFPVPRFGELQSSF